MSEKITGVLVDIPTIIENAKMDRMVDNLIGEKPDGWISVAERLPDKDQEVLAEIVNMGIGHFVYMFSPFKGRMVFSASDRFVLGWDAELEDFEDGSIIKWMPIPK